MDTVFSFLRRKTDFFAGPPGAEDGSAAAIAKVNQVLKKHAAKYQADKAPKKPKPTPKSKTVATATKAPSPKKETKPTTQQLPPKKKEDDVIEMTDDGFDISNAPAAVEPAVVAAAMEAVQKEEASKVAGGKEDDKEDDDDQKAPSPIGNGGQVPGKYVWTQTLSEVSITIPVPDNTRGKDLNVTIGRNHLQVGLRGTKTWIVDAPLIKTVIVDDSFWTVEDGSRLVINLQKLGQMEWWDSVCQGDDKIDVRKIQPENSNLGDLDGETRKTVEKMMFDQRQKALGLPSSEEQTKFDAIEKFKKAHPELNFENAKIS